MQEIALKTIINMKKSVNLDLNRIPVLEITTKLLPYPVSKTET
jgi:hypothetical protein